MFLKNEKSIIAFLDKIDFECQRCSSCCRHEPGAVFLTENDVEKIYGSLKINKDEFLKRYCRGLHYKNNIYVSLKERSNYDCIFWNNGCLVYKARPIQCKTYPFWPFIIESKESWDKESIRCKGIDRKSNLNLAEKVALYNEEKKAEHMKWPYEKSIYT